MRYILAASFFLLALLVSRGWAQLVTTQPAVPDVQSLRAQVRALQNENDMLRAQLAALSGGSPNASAGVAAAVAKGTSDSTDTPIYGLDAVFLGFPHDQMPGTEDPADGLRASLMRKWLIENALGKVITLRGRFGDTSGISNGHFTMHISSGNATHPFEAAITMPESEAPFALRFHKGSSVQVTGRIRSINVRRNNENVFVVMMDLDLASMTLDNSKPH